MRTYTYIEVWNGFKQVANRSQTRKRPHTFHRALTWKDGRVHLDAILKCICSIIFLSLHLVAESRLMSDQWSLFRSAPAPCDSQMIPRTKITQDDTILELRLKTCKFETQSSHGELWQGPAVQVDKFMSRRTIAEYLCSCWAHQVISQTQNESESWRQASWQLRSWNTRQCRTEELPIFILKTWPLQRLYYCYVIWLKTHK